MFEGKTFEYDPGYDPERLDGGGDNTESTPERNREVTPLIINVDCPEYSVTYENPYRYDANPPRPLDTIAATIEAPIRQHFMGRNITVSYSHLTLPSNYTAEDEKVRVGLKENRILNKTSRSALHTQIHTSISRKLKSLIWIKLLNRTQKSSISLLNQIQKVQATTRISLSN